MMLAGCSCRFHFRACSHAELAPEYILSWVRAYLVANGCCLQQDAMKHCYAGSRQPLLGAPAIASEGWRSDPSPAQADHLVDNGDAAGEAAEPSPLRLLQAQQACAASMHEQRPSAACQT